MEILSLNPTGILDSNRLSNEFKLSVVDCKRATMLAENDVYKNISEIRVKMNTILPELLLGSDSNPC